MTNTPLTNLFFQTKSIARITLFALLSLLPLAFASAAKPASAKNPVVVMKTDLGDVHIELFPKAAPVTVKNFITYVENGFYDGTIFHRVVPNFVVQGGGFRYDFSKKETMEPIVNEGSEKFKNLQGTISMARTNDPNSATSQFFLNLVDNPFLDAKKDNPGYAVFGKVVEGFDVLKKIEKEPQGLYKNPTFVNTPNIKPRILKAFVEKTDKEKAESAKEKNEKK